MSGISTVTSKEISVVRVVFEFYPLVGGSITHIIELSTLINPYLKNQIIIAPNFGDGCKEFDNNLCIEVIRVKYYPLKKIGFIPVLPLVNFLYLVNVYLKLKEIERPDIIHFHGIINLSFGVMIGKLLKVPTVGMLHCSLEAYSKISGFCETILAKLICINHAFILDDGSIAPVKFKEIWGSRAEIVFHAIDVNRFQKVERSLHTVDKLQLKESDFIIMSTSSLIPVKNIDLAIRSFKLFLEITCVTNAYFLIAGEGFLKNTLISLVEELELKDNVLFIGEIKNEFIIEYLSIADVVVSTSLYSNLNRSIQESMACEIPVVVFDSGGTSKLIEHMKNGMVVKSGDVHSFAKSIKFLYDDPQLRQIIGKNARDSILKERSWQKRIEQELEAYKKILNV